MKRSIVPLAVLYVIFSTAQSQVQREIVPGSPLQGLTGHELELFREGLEDFNEVETAEEGLGPAFNGNSCGSCHSIPAIGGVATMTETRAGYVDEDGYFTAMNGETLYNLFSTGKHACQVAIPPEANVIARRVPTPIFGDGLIEAIADATIIAGEDPEDRNGDGIKGRASRIFDVATRTNKIGRFGWKAQQATLLAFSGDAYRNEMGITNDLFLTELMPGIAPAQAKLCDGKPEPEDVRNRLTGLRSIDNFANFMRLLAPVERAPMTAEIQRGETLFTAIGCAACHTPTMMTAPSQNPVFDRKAVALYSDLLLHDIGTGDGIEQADATGDEIRTPPLWGLRFRRPLLHDGRAASYYHAIEMHAREAEASRKRAEALSPGDRTALLAFLGSL
ncbi:MAG: c-type cytochrome [Acidobacteria bacterium]|nr:c-type cytochrome [Acidobacteriota bacterium]